MKKVSADIVVMVNPVAPLIKPNDIDEMVSCFVKNDLDTLIPVVETRLHAFMESKAINFIPDSSVQSLCEAKAINFNSNDRLPMTQNIMPISICAWTVCIWRSKTFISEYESKGYAVFSGNMKLYPQSQLKAIKISTEEDFKLAELVLKSEN